MSISESPEKEYAKHHYTLIASAVAGRSVPVHWHDNQELSTYTDYQCIYVPAQQRGRSHVYDVITQALLLRMGSFKRAIVQRLIGRKKTSLRYVYAELVRAVRLNADLLPRHFCEQPAIAAFPYVTDDAESSLALARSRKSFPVLPEFIGTTRGALLLKTSLLLGDSAPVMQSLRQDRVAVVADEADDEQGEEDSLMNTLNQGGNPFLSGSKLAEMIKQFLSLGRSGKSGANAESGGAEEMPGGQVTQTAKKGFFTVMNELALELVLSAEADDPGSQSYPEWHCDKKEYRENWVLVDEIEPWRKQPESTETLAGLLQPPPTLLKRKFAGVGLSLEVHRNQLHGEDFTLDSVVDYFVDYRMGTTPNDRLYEHRMKTRRDLAVMVLLDVSGSTAEIDAGGQTIHHKQVQLAYHILSVLHELGDLVSLYGFQSWGRKMVRFLRLKSFKERGLDSRVMNRFAHLEPVGFTRTGAALRHGAKKLENETHLPYRLLIVITDGFAYDLDYEGKYGEEDTKKALEEVRASGTGCLCLTIGSDQEQEKLTEIFGAASTVSVRDYDEFVGNVRPALLRAIAQIKK